MAKVRPTNMKITGKVGNDVFIDNRYGHHVRRAPVIKANKKNEPAFKKQHIRTKLLNDLAGEVNRWVTLYYDHLKGSAFYTELQKCFRKEPIDNRFLLLHRLKGLEVNPDYPLGKLGECKVSVKGMPKAIMVTLKVEHHPGEGRYHANCYYNELLLLSWTNTKKPASAHRQFSEWIYFTKGKPEFEFVFPKPAGTIHWLLFLRQRLGKDEHEEGVNSLKGEGMQVVAVGSFDIVEHALLDKLTAEREEKRKRESLKETEEEVVRVKAKRVL